jgi:DNA-binding NarL/FixJ family response regulator
MQLVVIDDHPVVHQGLELILSSCEDMQLVGSAVTVDEGLELLRSLQPDVALVDLTLDNGAGLDVVRRGKEEAPDCRFAVLATTECPLDVRRAMAAGVNGYILKEILPEELRRALQLIGRGQTYVDPSLVHLFLGVHSRRGLDELTPRERDTLLALSRGLPNEQIASELNVSRLTAKKYVSQVLRKLKLENRTQAALYAFSLGLIDSG